MYFADGLAVNNIRRVRKIVGLMLAVVMAATVLAIANTEDAGAQPDQANQRAAEFCSAYHLFGGEPVDVAKTADNQTVLAQTSWRWNDIIGCYLVLDPAATATLRAAGPPASLPQGETETSRRCSAYHRFGGEPVDVAKTADNQTVLARLSWNSNSIIQCFLVLDPAAVATLRAAAMSPTPTVTAPGIPTGVTAIAGDRQITVAWTAPADDGGASITYYTVAYKAGSFVCPTTLDRTWTQRTTARTAITLSNLADGTAYRLCVKANNRVGGSGWATASATPASVPGAPTNVNLTGGDGQITATWTAAPDNGARITSYTIQRCNATGGACTSTWTDAGTSTTTRHTISGLSDGASYGIRIRATNANGPGGWSTTAYESTGAYPPDTPSEVTASIGNRYITLEWDAPDPNGSPITGYTVECRLSANTTTTGSCSSSSWTTYRTTSNTSVRVGSLTNGVSYDLRVKATNRAGSSDWSEVTTATASDTPGTPINFQAVNSGRNIRVTWSAPASGGAPITRYVVEYCSSTCSTTSISGDPPPTTATLSGLRSGTTYTVRVQAVNTAGESAWSRSDSATTPAVPGKPTGLNFTSITNSQITVGWTAPDSSALTAPTNYNVQYCAARASTDGSRYCTSSWYTAGTSTGTSLDITGLTGGTDYRVRVRAVNNAGNSAWSTTRSTTTLAAVAPGTPGGPTLTPGNKQITVRWTAPADNGARITRYTVECRDSDSTNTSGNCKSDAWAQYTTTTSTSITIRSLTNGTSYEVRVQATSSAGPSAWSDPASTTPAAAPGKPTNLTLSENFIAGTGDDLDQYDLRVSWSAATRNGSNLHGYTVEYRASGNSWSYADFVDQTDDSGNWSFTIQDLTPDTTYYVRVNTISDSGISGWATATTTISGRPGKPTITSLEISGTSITVSWNSVSSATDFDVQYKERTQSTWTTLSGSEDPMDGTTTTTTFTVPTSGTFYQVRVQAANSNGAGPWSDIPAAPGAPTGLTATPGSGQIALSWTAPTDNGGDDIKNYTVECKRTSGSSGSSACDTGSYAVSSTSATASATITGLTNGQTYSVRVKANNDAGSSGWVYASAKPANAPGAPTGLTANSGNAQIALSWTAPANDGGSAITNYTVSYKANAASCSPAPNSTWTTTTSSRTSTNIGSLTNGTSYGFCIRTNNNAGSSSWIYTSAKPATAPGKPTGLTADPGDKQIALSWTAPTDTGGNAINNYTVECKRNSGNQGSSTCDTGSYAVILTPAGTATSAEIPGLNNGQTYSVRIKANNNAGSSGWVYASAKPATVPGVPTSLTANRGNAQIDLSWTAPTDTGGSGITITSYTVQYRACTKSTDLDCSESSPTWGSWTEKTVTKTSTTITGLTNGTAYQVQVRANNDTGAGAPTAPVKAIPAAAPAAPTVFTTTPGKSRLALSWTKPTDTGGIDLGNYTVECKRNSGNQGSSTCDTSSYAVILTPAGTATSAEIPGLTHGQTYSVRIKANHNAGSSGWVYALGVPNIPVPGTPTVNTPTTGTQKITLSWTAPTDTGGSGITITSYTVRYRACTATPLTCSTNPTWGSWTEVSLTTTSKEITGLTTGTKYQLQVRAHNIHGPSDWAPATAKEATPD